MSYDHVDAQQQHLHAMSAYGGNGGSYPQHYDHVAMVIPSPFDPHPNHQQPHAGSHLSSSTTHSVTMHHPHGMHEQPSHAKHHPNTHMHHQHPPTQQLASYTSFQSNNPYESTMSLKRKSPMFQGNDQSPSPYAFVQAAASMPDTHLPSAPTHHIPPTSPLESSSVCDLCKHSDPILYIPDCGHTFHSRCIGEWPMVTCPTCHGGVPKVAVVHVDMQTKTVPRSGKWTKQEEKFVNLIVDEFDHGTFPLANGTPVRLVLAKLLNCSPMRLSKKFQKNALGKRTYRVPKSTHAAPNGSRICFDAATHQARQIEFSASEQAFREEVVLLQRKDNKMDGHIEVRDLRLAVVQFWVANFLKFALSVGQQVDGLDTTEPKKKKQTMQKLRDGMFDQVLSWAASEKKEAADGAMTHRPLPPPTSHEPPQPSTPWDETYFKSESFKPYGPMDNENYSVDDPTDHNYDEPVPFHNHEYKLPPHAPQPASHHHHPHPGPMQHAQAHHNLVASFGRDDAGGPLYGGGYGGSYKRPMLREHTPAPPSHHQQQRMALTPLSVRGGASGSMRSSQLQATNSYMPDTTMTYEPVDHNSSSADLDGLLMGGSTPSLRPQPPPSLHQLQLHQTLPPSSSTTYDAMDPMPTNSSWDQMLDDFTGINSQLVVDQALNTGSWL
ncbi:hypothetical protein H310_11163 [Aphanomyces invadans]|uniref:RING-type domain-containing protein n=1 Tax=Aphanomyces invadans TaxID=157072 RepID=A0A024TMK0_9STRA|nr:hypothetical protein H310_11163 [Aphanomyces invadans]ETV95258.1 hypothetical protein H310_11163 [Aphanomyces invadans]|eukprot:XP_008875959.1 hypothetical protein H310_11163 [Aphanomyces invadans]